MIKFIYEQDVNIETENPGVLEVPEGKNVEDLPIKHFVDIANRKGLATVTRALNNLQVWNKNKNKSLSKWAGDMIDKVSKRFENQQKNESLQKLNEEFITVDIPQKVYDFHFSGMDKDGYNRDVNKVCVKYYGKGQFVELLLIDDNGIRLGTSRKKFKLVGSDVIITDADKNDIVIGKVLTNESLIREDVTLDLVEEKELAEFIDWLNEVNIPVAKVNRKFKNITLKNRDDLDEASFYLQDRDYFKKLHDFGWVVSVRA